MPVIRKRTFTLKFQDYDNDLLDGLEVKARSVSIDDYLEISDLLGNVEGPRVGGRERYLNLLEKFAPVLVEWNAQEELDPGQVTDVPLSVAGLMSLEEWVATEIVRSWLVAVSSVPVPLARPSSDGEQSPALSTLPVEMLSDSPTS
jgi:hypothetical protein